MVSSHTSRAVFAGLAGAAALWSAPTVALAAPVTNDSTLIAGASAAAGFAVGAACVVVASHKAHRAQAEALEQRIRLLEAQVAAQAAGTQAMALDPWHDYADESTEFDPSQGSASYEPHQSAALLVTDLAPEAKDASASSQAPEPSAADSAPAAEKTAAPEVAAAPSKGEERGLLRFPDKSGSLPKLEAENNQPTQADYHSKHVKGQAESFSVEELLARWQAERAEDSTSQEEPAESFEPQAQTASSSEIAQSTSEAAQASEPEAAAAQDLEPTSEPAALKGTIFSAAEVRQRIPEIQEDQVTSAPQMAAPAQKTGIHAAASVDYERVASDYLDRKSFKNRMLAISKGVSQVLSERLGGSMMDDLPMIQRADGTVADLGTSWWEAAAQANELEISRDLDVDLEGLFDTNTVLETAEDVVSAVSTTASFQKPFSFAAERWGVSAEKPTSAPETSKTAGPSGKTTASAPSGVSAKASKDSADLFDTDAFLAQVGYAPKAVVQPYMASDEVFPEMGADAEAGEDVWQEALDALDVRFDDNLVSGSRQGVTVKVHSSAPEPVKGDFFDLIGGIDTLDEPDGLEPDTEFLTFRTPAGHPEVQDTNSYINYLVEHELEGNSSQVVRDRARRFFQEDTEDARQVV